MSTNLFAGLGEAAGKEVFTALLDRPGLRIERIVSAPDTPMPGEWYDQDGDEWVALLAGSARLRFEDEAEDRVLSPGDWLLIPARRRHRVVAVDRDAPTVWLAVHLSSTPAEPP